MEQATQKTWWGRNWKWFVPLGCLTPVVVCGGGIALFVAAIMGALRSSDAYTEALATARANEEVQALLGEPIEAGFWTTGNINVSNGSGNADLSIPISGPKGSATIHAVATKDAGQWQFSELQVEPANAAADSIDLLTERLE